MSFVSTVRVSDVNRLLRAAGLMTISRIDIASPDVAMAVDTLDDLDIQMQSEGWYFNTEFDYPIIRDTDNYLRLPGNFLDARMQNNKWTARGSSLYDLENHTFVATEDLDIQELVLRIDFPDTPVVYQQALLTAAEAKFFADMDGDQNMLRNLEVKAQQAKFTLRQRDLQRKHVNALNNSTAGKLLAKFPTTNVGEFDGIIGGAEWQLTK